MATANCRGQSITEFLIITLMITLIFFTIARHFLSLSKKNLTYQLTKPQTPTQDGHLGLDDLLNEFLKNEGVKK